MATETLDLAETIYKEAKQLPPASLADLAKYLESLKFKAAEVKPEQSEGQDDNIWTRSDGVLAGCDFSPESLAEARNEM